MNDDHLVSTLNDLIQISIDGEKGFLACANDARERRLRHQDFFMTRATDCAQTVLDLQDLVRRLGGEPAANSTLGGTLQRQWMRLKSALTGRDDASILEECERGEEAAIQAYRKALGQELPVDIRLLVERQYQGVLATHSQVRRLRQQLHAHETA